MASDTLTAFYGDLNKENMLPVVLMMDSGLTDYHLGGDNDRGGVISLSGFGIDQGVDDRSTFDMMDSFGPTQGLFDDADTSYFDRSHMSMDLGAPEPEVSPLMPGLSNFRATSPVPNKVRRAPAPTIVPPQPSHVTRGGKSAPKTRDGTGAQQWVDPETVMCEQCGSGDSAQELLICDGCNKGRHTYCLPFALTLEQVAELPKWYCPACVLSRAKLKQKSNVYLRKYYSSVPQKIKRDKAQPTLEQAIAQGMLFIGEDDEEDEKNRKVLTASSETSKKRVPAKKSVDQSANNKRKKSTRRGSESEESDEDEDEKPVRKRRALTSSNSGANNSSTSATNQNTKKSPTQASVKPQVTPVIASTAPAPSTQNIDAVFLSLVPLPNRMPLPQLHFRDKTLSELYDRVPSQTYECLDWHDFRIEFMPQQSSAHTPLSLTHAPQSQAAFNYPEWPVKQQPGPPRDVDVKPKKEMMPGPGPGMPPTGSYAPPPVKPQPGMTSHPINFPVTGPPTSPFAPPSPYGTAPSYPFDQAKPTGPTTAPYPAPFPTAGYPKAPPMNAGPGPGQNYFPGPAQNPAMNAPNTAPGPMMINTGPYPAPSHSSNPPPEQLNYQSPNSAPMNYPSPPKPGPAPNQTSARGPQGTVLSAVNPSAPGPYPAGTAPLPSRPSNMKWHNNVAPSPNPPPIPPSAKNPARLIWNQAVPSPPGYRPGPVPPTAGTMPPNRTAPSQPYLTAPAQNVPKQIPMNPDQRPM